MDMCGHLCLYGCRRAGCTGATPGLTRSSALIWRLEKTGRWCWPVTTWTCSPCLFLRVISTGVTGQQAEILSLTFGGCCGRSASLMMFVCLLSYRTHANGSIKRGNKDNATDSVSLRTGIGVQLKDIKVFNRARQQGEQHLSTNMSFFNGN